MTINGSDSQRGFIFATVLVFLVVLSLVAFFAARLTRANTQVVNNLQNEKQAFFVAEAGVDEALHRLSLKSPNCTSMGIGPGISSCSGTTFDASIAPRIGNEPFRSNLGITTANSASTTQILLSTATPSSSGNNLITPSLQPSSVRMPYSTATADASPVDLTATSNLSIGWDVCSAPNASTGCSATADPYYPIRGLPLSSPRPVVKIVSTGTVQRPNGDVVASRKVTVRAVDCTPSTTNGSILTTDTSCNGISIGGSSTITTAGGIQVNGGAGVSGSCTNAISTGGTSSITAGGDITSVGGASGSSYTPIPKTGQAYVQDPYNDPPKTVLYPPCFGSRNTNCDATNTVATVRNNSESGGSTLTVSAPTNLQPGIYYGGISITGTGVTLAPGIYVMAGGGFQVTTGSTQVTGTDVLIVNTLNASPSCTSNCAAGSIDISAGNVGTQIGGVTSGTYDGFAFFQDRIPGNNGNLPATQPIVFIQGGTQSAPVVNGIVYAPNAILKLQGNNTITMQGSLIVSAITTNGSPSLDITNSGNPGNACSGPIYSRISWQDF
jgi:Tfp pilus assembly protein PilX